MASTTIDQVNAVNSSIVDLDICSVFPAALPSIPDMRRMTSFDHIHYHQQNKFYVRTRVEMKRASHRRQLFTSSSYQLHDAGGKEVPIKSAFMA